MSDLVGLGKALEPFSQGSVGLLRRLFGPAATEIGEAFADKVRSYRKANFSAVLAKAEEKIGSAEFEELPLRFSIPFAEKASLSDDDSLTDMWATLLASAATSFEPEHISFVNILARLSPAEAKLLSSLVPTDDPSLPKIKSVAPKFAIFRGRTDGGKDAIADSIAQIARDNMQPDGLSDQGKVAAERIVGGEFSNLVVEWISLRKATTGFSPAWTASNAELIEKYVSIDLLQAEGLVTRSLLQRSSVSFEVSTTIVSATALGWMFVQSCRPDQGEG
ncbi:MAG: hypothetical protein ABJK59_06720 [Erythrobacter sp.]|uniref:Abi-alpha family protein n=1 Tax=Erythrobacter sp. TaxID=1042 RepID=UPI0032983260